MGRPNGTICLRSRAVRRRSDRLLLFPLAALGPSLSLVIPKSWTLNLPVSLSLSVSSPSRPPFSFLFSIFNSTSFLVFAVLAYELPFASPFPLSIIHAYAFFPSPPLTPKSQSLFDLAFYPPHPSSLSYISSACVPTLLLYSTNQHHQTTKHLP